MFISSATPSRYKAVAMGAVVAAALFLAPISAANAAPVASHSVVAAGSVVVPKVSKLTYSQQQAYIAGKSYLRLGSGFSYLGLVGQLSSKYGSGFSKKDAIAAVKALHPNWKAQAVLSAKGYLKLGTGFSHASLISQLTSKYGSQYTLAQAKYAVKKVGL